MLTGLPAEIASILPSWIEDAVRHQHHVLGSGYQGSAYLFERGSTRLVIKAALGHGLGALARRRMLRREHRVYERLAGVNGVPRCYGMLDGRYLVLEYVGGVPFRGATIPDRERFFDELGTTIAEIHTRGVAHGDLKKKDNLLVTRDGRPTILDFGVAVIRRGGFAPINHWLYALAARFDTNACAKLRLGRTPDPERDEETYGYRRTTIERVSSWIKRHYLALREVGTKRRTP